MDSAWSDCRMSATGGTGDGRCSSHVARMVQPSRVLECQRDLVLPHRPHHRRQSRHRRGHGQARGLAWLRRRLHLSRTRRDRTGARRRDHVVRRHGAGDAGRRQRRGRRPARFQRGGHAARHAHGAREQRRRPRTPDAPRRDGRTPMDARADHQRRRQLPVRARGSATHVHEARRQRRRDRQPVVDGVGDRRRQRVHRLRRVEGRRRFDDGRPGAGRSPPNACA